MTRLELIHRRFVGFDNALGRQIAAYQTLHPNVDVGLHALDVPPLYDRMITGGGATSGDYDLFLAVTDWLPRMIKDGLATCLDDYLRLDPPPDWPAGWVPTLRGLQQDTHGRVYGIAYHDGPEVFMYRTDLFADPSEQARFKRAYGRDLTPPSTWSEFLNLAVFFNRPDEDLRGCVVAAKPDGHNNVYDFVLHLWSRGGQLLDERMRPAFAGPEGQAALRFYLDLIHEHRVTQPNPWDYESTDSGAYYASGRAAMMWNWCGFQSMADMPGLSQIPGRTRSTMLPAGDAPAGRSVSLIVYWVMTMASGSRHPDAAWSFMRHLATPAMDLITTDEGNSGTRLTTWRSPSVRRRFQYYEVIEDVHRQARTLPPIPEYPAINEVLNTLMASTVRGLRPVEPALREAAEATEQLLAEAGYYDGRLPTI